MGLHYLRVSYVANTHALTHCNLTDSPLIASIFSVLSAAVFTEPNGEQFSNLVCESNTVHFCLQRYRLHFHTVFLCLSLHSTANVAASC